MTPAPSERLTPDLPPLVSQPRPPIAPSVRFESRATSGIALEVLTAFRAQAQQGVEAGGILLGSRTGDPIVVTDFEPVLCEHRFGPCFALSDSDSLGLEESVDWFRTSASTDLQVLGFYRSHARADASPDDRDNELMARFFGDRGALFLLLKPGRGDTITAELFVMGQGGLRPSGYPMVFPSDQAISAMQVLAAAGAESAAAAAIPEAPAPRPVLPPPHPRRTETQELPRRNWTWIAGLAGLTIAAAVLGYLSVAPRHAEVPPPSPQAPASAPAPAGPPAAATGAAEVVPPHTSTPPADAEEGVRNALAQWERAVLSGDPDQVADCYASQLDRYFDQANASPEEVRRAIAQAATRYGKPAILRIYDLKVTPVSESRAVASFRKHWQTGGPKIVAGEEQERLTFVKTADAWKIASEEQTKVYWRQGPRA
ncbi:MAG TPA: hypothetical protein VKU19_36805 [Bryobacteraceae bacterium]|nr:hypothetical protein [Bryobacteraceae bacterium]